ncbi:MAG: hypothetical protein KAF91_23945 [Nostoc sp. TH1S01]|nr:hypothetical protein [Nostoc sp. TH1S01]
MGKNIFKKKQSSDENKFDEDIFEELVRDWKVIKEKLKDKDFLLGCVEVRRIIDNIPPWIYEFSTPQDYENWKIKLIENYPEVMNVAL